MKPIDSLESEAAPRTKIPRSPCRWNWHYRALVKLRERLLKHRSELAEAVSQPLEPFSLDMADAATDQFDHDLALSRLSAEQDVLYEIAGALERIGSGSYGVCEATGQPIPPARLRAIPWTRYSREVEEELERHAVCRRPHLGELQSVHRVGSVDRLSPADDEEEEAV